MSLQTQFWSLKLSSSFWFSKRVVRRTSPGFKLLWELESGQRRDWDRARQDLLELFETGKASPRDIDPDGQTWLEKLLYMPWYDGNADIQLSLFHMLARMGTQINTPRLLYQSAKWVDEEDRLDLLGDLLHFGFDASEIEAPLFSHLPKPCPPSLSVTGTNSDPFFINWISKNLEVSPGKLDAILSMEKLLKKFNVDDQDNLLGLSTLHLAVSRPQHLGILLESGADVNARDRHGITPLMYATAIGDSKVAIRLLEAGANPDLEDTYCGRNFLHHAVRRSHWDTVLEILSYLRNSPKISKDILCRWLSFGLLLWIEGRQSCNKDLNPIQRLLEWGADPNVIHYDSYGPSSYSLAHRVRHAADMKSLISHGFSKFNHLDIAGADALISLSYDNDGLPDPELLELLLDGGCAVSHENHNGHTSLHVIAQQLRAFRYNESCSRALNCIRVLLNRGADPYIGDHCQCYCSRGQSGCTPSHTMLKETQKSILNCRYDIWAFEYIDILKETRGPETAKNCLMDMLRLLKFQDLDLTHTCCRGSHLDRNYSGRRIEDEEVEEIQDEEKELIEILEQEMRDVEKTLGDDTEDQLLTAVSLLLTSAKLGSKFTFRSFRANSSKERYQVDHWRDQLVDHGSTGPLHDVPETKEVDTIGLDGYIDWVEYQHSKNRKRNKADDEWYKKRLSWVSRLRNMEEAEIASQQAAILDQPKLLITSI
ncbi:uncharacterized protein BP5553_06713 [Venustampulla echinocandica]|uniref:Uncharacterized protein n=1 Tax=Venustampulla echinocandica TaxID=2656787 RepID=A0A370TKP9_9HELO|nr:uncharacterized protein BP5553_06713 [Venustampulla echinocandica]RDL36101.1 hypothetical protein BP5553_06713 [Venustampulla echinocandica]